MFDIAWTEILVVAVIAIIVVGPKELPGMLRAFGKTFSQVRRTAREFQSTFNDALREAERQADLDDVRKDFSDMRSMDPTKALRKGLDDTKKQLSGKIDGTAKSDAKSDAKPDTATTPAAGETPTAETQATETPATETPTAAPEAASATPASAPDVVPLKTQDTTAHEPPRPAPSAETGEAASDADKQRAAAGSDR